MDTAPDPTQVRVSTRQELARLGVPASPSDFPLVWGRGDHVALRPIEEIEARAAVLNVVLARVFGMSDSKAMQWLLDARLLEHVSPTEWQFIATGRGDRQSFVLQLEALYALTWLLGLVSHLDPELPCVDGLPTLMPNLRDAESFAHWRSRTLPAPREPAEAAALLDLYYCLDQAYADRPPPGPVSDAAVAQRRFALEWAVRFA